MLWLLTHFQGQTRYSTGLPTFRQKLRPFAPNQGYSVLWFSLRSSWVFASLRFRRNKQDGAVHFFQVHGFLPEEVGKSGNHINKSLFVRFINYDPHFERTVRLL